MEIRTTFHKRLRKIQDDVLVMGSMVEKAIERSIEALKKRDQELAGKIIEDDQAINRKRFSIEEKCV
ncbi:MAG: phosphate transport system regulatory protein PhoU, partial [Chloroflexi bacterium]|nr:phosphate transport system regulatory protein PhoU [Chloroflexota bacterium]